MRYDLASGSSADAQRLDIDPSEAIFNDAWLLDIGHSAVYEALRLGYGIVAPVEELDIYHEPGFYAFRLADFKERRADGKRVARHAPDVVAADAAAKIREIITKVDIPTPADEIRRSVPVMGRPPLFRVSIEALVERSERRGARTREEVEFRAPHRGVLDALSQARSVETLHAVSELSQEFTVIGVLDANRWDPARSGHATDLCQPRWRP